MASVGIGTAGFGRACSLDYDYGDGYSGEGARGRDGVGCLIRSRDGIGMGEFGVTLAASQFYTGRHPDQPA